MANLSKIQAITVSSLHSCGLILKKMFALLLSASLAAEIDEERKLLELAIKVDELKQNIEELTEMVSQQHSNSILCAISKPYFIKKYAYNGNRQHYNGVRPTPTYNDFRPLYNARKPYGEPWAYFSLNDASKSSKGLGYMVNRTGFHY